ncbi:phosphate transporter PitA [Candidatus Riesia sp. GBBU]|nr:phosphate transporter PitA [Candidatus Riesia sp. GBBU]ARC55080.1 phosphate transporter PitA [Candidatus Riesia sp. GBBU]
MLNSLIDLDFYTNLILSTAIFLALFHEIINGFHDTANAVATIIYTRAVQARFAVIISGIFNFFGVIFGGLSVSYAIIHLLPINLLLNINSIYGLTMVFSILLSTIIWNLVTWYFGLPTSSSHTLIGSIIGVILINSFVIDSSVVEDLNIPKVTDIFLSLFLSPLIGCIFSGTIILLLRIIQKETKICQQIHFTPIEREKKEGKKKPPFCIRIVLILSSIGVSFSHGSNDGQKGIGLVMLILISILPTKFSLNMNASEYEISRIYNTITNLKKYYEEHSYIINNTKFHIKNKLDRNVANINYCYDNFCPNTILNQIISILKDVKSYSAIKSNQRSYVRKMLLYLSEMNSKIAKHSKTKPEEAKILYNLNKDLLITLEYAPVWITVIVASALAIGTMFGWKRATFTIGKKIGKKDMTYAHGVSAQTTAAISIGIASYTGMPVSTTQILSSAVAGAMIIDRRGIQIKTVKNILLVWLFTFPISITMSGIFYWVSLKIF